MSGETFLLAMVVVAAVPANLFPLLYLTAPWRATVEGWALMVLGVGLALMVDSSLLRRTLGEHYPGRDLLFAGVLIFVIGGMYAITAVLAWRRWQDWRTEHRRV